MKPITIRLFVNNNNGQAARQGKPGPMNVSFVSVVTEADVPNPNAALFNGAQGAAGMNLQNVAEDIAARFPRGQEFEVTFTPVDTPTPSTKVELAAALAEKQV